MLAARLHGVGDLRVGTEPEPGQAPPGWSLVRVTSVGVCGSDLHWFTDGGIGENRIDNPVVPGHEFAGVALTGPYAGRRVAVDPAIPCGQCEMCGLGYHNLCPTVQFAGHGDVDGALQEQLLWPDHLLFPLPDSLSDDAGALLEPLGVAIHAAAVGHVRPDSDVLVVGAGPIGVLSVAAALRRGARRVFVTEPLEHRRRTALRFGAAQAWEPSAGAVEVLDATEGRGVDVVIEAAGTDPAIATAVAAVRPGGRVALGGIPSEELSSFPAAPARRKGITFAMVRRMNDTYPRAIELATSGVDLDALVTARHELADAEKAFLSASQRHGDKVVVAVSAG
ncbi:sorbitol dehydrogenase [Mycolicibacterium murale]|uniref:Sorbitol dehydrogenase n=1 Tax=Mycolicibacterium murale TaxID=182220 RepID=A0A7I9WH52_9MYCO|nr:alcohol dehydrogenase catalytic domain-containing protein [Mycolicibacterium murale]MCV7180637.1 alcohol dehydrogenase catalytic domain-containing protein [Mycolicibacterium murale]GFG56859.1 sorbitol dehydrogenase [Mycolicibacterium murale]